MELLPYLLSAILLVLLIAILGVFAERSLNRQRGGKLRRGQEERNAAGRVLEKYFRW